MEWMEIRKIEKPDTTKMKELAPGAVMLRDGTGCMVYVGPVGLYIYHINSDTWHEVVHVQKHEMVVGKKKDVKTPF